MNFFSRRIFLVITFVTGFINSATATVTLPSFFTDNMVLQQKASVPFWGKSNAKLVKVTTSWNTYQEVKVVNGNWEVKLNTPAFGGPYTITINDGKKLELKNILIGEVWLCSGQSNMEMPLEGWGKIQNFKEEIAAANYPEIRMIQAVHADSAQPITDLKVENNGWQVCSPATIANFSATAYFFARKVYNETHVPIGLVHSSWGGTIIEAWTSADALKTVHDFDEALAAMTSDENKEALLAKYNTDIKVWLALLEKSDKGMQGTTVVWAAPEFNDSQWKTMKLPGYMEFNGLPDVDGAVWFRKTITLPDNFTGKDLVLNCLVDDDDKVWVNGTYIGGTSGYNTPRNYIIKAGIFKKGTNIITIRAYDSTGGGGIYGSPSDLTLKTGEEVFPLAGEWKYAVGVNTKDLPAQPSYPQGQYRPSAIYNSMIYPLLKLPLAGVIWYQGESNAERAEQYQKLFPLLINDWRAKFGIKNLPFYYVQLANYKVARTVPTESDWAELREAQYKTLSLPFTGMAVTTDIGNAEDIHPKDKQDVGLRLALIALAKTYGLKIAYSGPLYKSFAITGANVALEFAHYEGITAKDGKLKGFTIAGADKKFYPAEAKIIGSKVVVSSAKVDKPEAVRYNWADNPEGNLTNASGLPASSFRTDTWLGITHGKK